MYYRNLQGNESNNLNQKSSILVGHKQIDLDPLTKVITQYVNAPTNIFNATARDSLWSLSSEVDVPLQFKYWYFKEQWSLNVRVGQIQLRMLVRNIYPPNLVSMWA